LNGNHGWKDALVDAGISAGGAFFGVASGIPIAGIVVDPLIVVGAGGIAAGTAFFGSLAAARRRPPEPAPP
jgi:hypothetical protein